MRGTTYAAVPPPPSPPPLTNPSPPPFPSPPPDLTLNITYSPPPAPRQWDVLVPCNVTVYVSPPPPPFLILGVLEPLTFAIFVIFLSGVAAYFLRKRHLRLAHIASLAGL